MAAFRATLHSPLVRLALVWLSCGVSHAEVSYRRPSAFSSSSRRRLMTTCIDRATFPETDGGCETYAQGEPNEYNCYNDAATTYCSECLECVDAEPSPSPPPAGGDGDSGGIMGAPSPPSTGVTGGGPPPPPPPASPPSPPSPPLAPGNDWFKH